MNSTESIFDFSPEERLDYEQTLLRLLFATQISNYLEDAKIQHQELAKRMGKSKSWLSKLLSGSHNPTIDSLAEVATALGLRWNAQLSPTNRGGTKAIADPEPPKWVQNASLPSSTSFVHEARIVGRPKIYREPTIQTRIYRTPRIIAPKTSAAVITFLSSAAPEGFGVSATKSITFTLVEGKR